MKGTFTRDERNGRFMYTGPNPGDPGSDLVVSFLEEEDRDEIMDVHQAMKVPLFPGQVIPSVLHGVIRTLAEEQYWVLGDNQIEEIVACVTCMPMSEMMERIGELAAIRTSGEAGDEGQEGVAIYQRLMKSDHYTWAEIGLMQACDEANLGEGMTDMDRNNLKQYWLDAQEGEDYTGSVEDMRKEILNSPARFADWVTYLHETEVI